MSEITLKQLRCFVAVYTERNFTRAAVFLGMKQSPVSQAVATLERQLDQKLIVRGAHEATPTPAADARYPEALELRRRAESLPLLVTESRNRKLRDRIRLGAASSAFLAIVPEAIKVMKDYSVVISDGRSADLIGAVQRGDMDMCLIREFDGDEDNERIAFRERLVVALPSRHPLANRVDLAAEEIADEPVISFNRDYSPIAFDLVAGVFLQAGSRMNIIAYLSSEQAILSVISAGQGIALLPESVRLAGRQGVKFVPLRGSAPTYPLTVRTAPGDPIGLLEPVTEALADWARRKGLSD